MSKSCAMYTLHTIYKSIVRERRDLPLALLSSRPTAPLRRLRPAVQVPSHATSTEKAGNKPGLSGFARETGLEPATSAVTGRRSNQLSYSRKRGTMSELVHSFSERSGSKPSEACSRKRPQTSSPHPTKNFAKCRVCADEWNRTIV